MSNPALEVWLNLQEQPVDASGALWASWRHFPIGTPIYDIWHWLEHEFDVSIGNEFKPSGAANVQN